MKAALPCVALVMVLVVLVGASPDFEPHPGCTLFDCRDPSQASTSLGTCTGYEAYTCCNASDISVVDTFLADFKAQLWPENDGSTTLVETCLAKVQQVECAMACSPRQAYHLPAEGNAFRLSLRLDQDLCNELWTACSQTYFGKTFASSVRISAAFFTPVRFCKLRPLPSWPNHNIDVNVTNTGDRLVLQPEVGALQPYPVAEPPASLAQGDRIRFGLWPGEGSFNVEAVDRLGVPMIRPAGIVQVEVNNGGSGIATGSATSVSSFDASYTVVQSGRHTIDVSLNGEPVSQSPFYLNFLAPAECPFYGPLETPNQHVTMPTEGSNITPCNALTVSTCCSATDLALDAIAEQFLALEDMFSSNPVCLERAQELLCGLTCGPGQDEYIVYDPTLNGTGTGTGSCNGTAGVNGTAFNATLSGNSTTNGTCNQAPYTFSVCASFCQLLYQSCADTSIMGVPVSAVYASAADFCRTIPLQEFGGAMLTTNVIGGPSVDATTGLLRCYNGYGNGAPCSRQSYHRDSESTTVAEPASFTIVALDCSGHAVTQGGGCWDVVISDPRGSTYSPVSIVDNADGTYTVTYVSTVAGIHSVSVTSCQSTEPIQNSPFPVLIEPGPISPVNSYVLSGECSDVTQYGEGFVVVQGVDVYGNNLTHGPGFVEAELVDPLQRAQPVNVTSVGCNGQYVVSYEPADKDLTLPANFGLCVSVQGVSIFCCNFTLVERDLCVWFTESAARIEVQFSQDTNQAGMVGDDDCSVIVVDPSVLGAPFPATYCTWTSPSRMRISLGPGAVISLGDRLHLLVSERLRTASGQEYTGDCAVANPFVGKNFTSDPRPQLRLVGPTFVSQCTSFAFDARYSFQVGGRPLSWTWSLASADPPLTSDQAKEWQSLLASSQDEAVLTFPVAFANHTLVPGGRYTVGLVAENHLGEKGSASLAFEVAFYAVPLVTVQPTSIVASAAERIKLLCSVRDGECPRPGEGAADVVSQWTTVGTPFFDWPQPEVRTASLPVSVIPGNTLQIGDPYTLSCTGSYVSNPLRSADSSITITVVNKKPLVWFLGGEKRLFPKGGGPLVLNVFAQDEDNRPDQAFTYTYTCEDLIAVGPISGCPDAATMAAQTGPTLTLPQSALGLGHFRFGVTVTKAYAGALSASATTEVFTDADTQRKPEVRVFRQELVLGSAGTLTVTSEVGFDPASGPLTFQWSAPSNNVDLNALSEGPLTGRAIRLLPGAMGSDAIVTLRLEVTNALGGTGFAEVTVKPTDRPNGGRCSVLPGRCGYAFVDSFYIVCERFEEDQRLLRFRHFMLVSSPFSPGPQRAPLHAGFWYSPVLELDSLSPGTYRFVTQVYDATEQTYTEYFYSVDVVPMGSCPFREVDASNKKRSSDSPNTSRSGGVDAMSHSSVSSLDMSPSGLISRWSPTLGEVRAQRAVDLTGLEGTELSQALLDELEQNAAVWDPSRITQRLLRVVSTLNDAAEVSDPVSVELTQRRQIREDVLSFIVNRLRLELSSLTISWRLSLLADVGARPGELSNAGIQAYLALFNSLLSDLRDFNVSDQDVDTTAARAAASILAVGPSRLSAADYESLRVSLDNLVSSGLTLRTVAGLPPIQVSGTAPGTGSTIAWQVGGHFLGAVPANYSLSDVTFTFAAEVADAVRIGNSAPVVPGTLSPPVYYAFIVVQDNVRADKESAQALVSPIAAFEWFATNQSLIDVTSLSDAAVRYTIPASNTGVDGVTGSCEFWNGTSYVGTGCRLLDFADGTAVCGCTHLSEFVVSLINVTAIPDGEGPVPPVNQGALDVSHDPASVTVVLAVLVGVVGLFCVFFFMWYRMRGGSVPAAQAEDGGDVGGVDGGSGGSGGGGAAGAVDRAYVIPYPHRPDAAMLEVGSDVDTTDEEILKHQTAVYIMGRPTSDSTRRRSTTYSSGTTSTATSTAGVGGRAHGRGPYGVDHYRQQHARLEYEVAAGDEDRDGVDGDGVFDMVDDTDDTHE